MKREKESIASFFSKKPKTDGARSSPPGEQVCSSPEQRETWRSELEQAFLYSKYPDAFFDLW